MASPAFAIPDEKGSRSLLGPVVVLGILHTVVVYVSALRVSPWVVYHWFGWVAPIMKISIGMPATDWYLRHLEVVTIIPALTLGYCNVARFFPLALRNYLGGSLSESVATWAWVFPASILGYKMLRYLPPSSVLYGTSTSAIKYFFDIQKFMPTFRDFRGSDPVRVLAQMMVTAPFYAGIAYSIGALESKHRLLTKLFTFEKYDEPARSKEE
jgi:hypothetical protein